MLVLSRRQHQQIYIGDDVVVTIVEIRGNTIRIGIDAPKGTQILRDDAGKTTPPADRIEQ